MIIKLKVNEEFIQLAMAINFISSKDSDETRTMHAKSNKIEIKIRKKICKEDIKLVTTNKRRNQLVSEPNYHATK